MESVRHADYIAMHSETGPRRPITARFCQGFGVDLGSGGDPVVPFAVQVDTNPRARQIVHCFQDASRDLPFKDSTLDYVYSSHLLEDFAHWDPILTEWLRVLKPGGHLIIMVPDKERYRAAVSRGQPDNLDHKHEASVGELTEFVMRLSPKSQVIMDKFSEDNDTCYNIVFVARK